VAGAGALAYVFIDQMNAASDTKAASMPSKLVPDMSPI